MAEDAGGLLAILGKPTEGKGKTESSSKARAMEAMHKALKAGDYEAAAEEFQAAYDECGMKEDEDTDEEE